MNEKKYYLAYGSNLNLKQMKRRCPGARAIGTSLIQGYELMFKGSKSGAYLTIEKNASGIVPVAVWEVSYDNECSLDRYEGYPDFYYKAKVRLDVKIFSGATKLLDCFVYIMHEERKLGVPSSFYVQTCLEGYDDFGFDKNILINSVKRSLKQYERANV